MPSSSSSAGGAGGAGGRPDAGAGASVEEVVRVFEGHGVERVSREWVGNVLTALAPIAAEGVWELFLCSDLSQGRAAGKVVVSGEEPGTSTGSTSTGSTSTSSIRNAGSGALPPLVASSRVPDELISLHRDVLPGPLLLQVTEACDVANPPSLAKDDGEDGDSGAGAGAGAGAAHDARDRDDDDDDDDDEWVTYTTLGKRATGRAARLLRVVLHDGFQPVHALELAPMPALDAAVPGTKLLVSNVTVRRGHLILDDHVSLTVLGGAVTNWGVAPEDPNEAVLRRNRAAVVVDLDADDDDDDFA